MLTSPRLTSKLASAAQQAVEDRRPHLVVTGTVFLSPVVMCHGLAHRTLLPLGFLMRPLLDGSTLGGLEGARVTLKVATCQFPISHDIARNSAYVLRQMRLARTRGARVAHFPECALSGYAGVDFRSFGRFDWALLRQATDDVLQLARELELWVVLGSSHQLSDPHKPHNCQYVIDPSGRIVDRYDKMFCAGDRKGRTGDLAHFSPGSDLRTIQIGRFKCGFQICHEYRYPELYRALKARGVQLVFHSYHAGNVSPARLKMMRNQVGMRNHRWNHGTTLPEITMPAAMHSAAASNHLWISCANTSAPHSCWPSFVVRPDGVVTGRLRRNRSGILVTAIDPRTRFYDSTAPWRDRAMRAILHSGTIVRDPRSADRDSL